MDGIETKNVFIKLAARLDDPEKIKSLPEILKLMITEKEAGILLYLPGTVEEVQKIIVDINRVDEQGRF